MSAPASSSVPGESAGLVYNLGWVFGRLMLFGFCRGRVTGVEHLPKAGPALLACNHASYLDPIFVGSATWRPLTYLGRATLFEHRLFGAVIRSTNSIPLDRDGGGPAGLRTVLNALAQGRAVVLFPEGTRTRDGRLQPVRPGVGLIALKSAAPVVPVWLEGTFQVWGRDRRVPRPARVEIRFGPPVDLAPLRAAAATAGREQLKALYASAAQAILAALAAQGRVPMPPPPSTGGFSGPTGEAA
ncbi:MAG: lysophospholipid acyltransferase family protein [Limisphaerales bacterium]